MLLFLQYMLRIKRIAKRYENIIFEFQGNF